MLQRLWHSESFDIGKGAEARPFEVESNKMSSEDGRSPAGKN